MSEEKHKMFSRDQLPVDSADWKSITIDFARLANDTVKSCPLLIDDVIEYVKMESADSDNANPERLTFLRTAKIAEAQFWLWQYLDKYSTLNYVTFRLNPDSSSVLGISESNGLSPEQYLLADYYDEVYWP